MQITFAVMMADYSNNDEVIEFIHSFHSTHSEAVNRLHEVSNENEPLSSGAFEYYIDEVVGE